MADILDFERGREAHQHKRKEAKVDALRDAFRAARSEQSAKDESRAARRRKRRKSSKK